MNSVHQSNFNLFCQPNNNSMHTLQAADIANQECCCVILILSPEFTHYSIDSLITV